MPRYRAEPEDFEVEEIPLFPPLGHGPHTHLWVEKRLATTDAVARALARLCGVPAREVGYAGRKDRRAVTRQWFSVPELDPEVAAALELPGARVLEARRHPHKLRVGQLAGNRFRLVVRDVRGEAAEWARRRLAELGQHGMPNRFGRQRFGWEGANVDRGAAILDGRRLQGDRRQALLMVSALQAAVFNHVLTHRPAAPDQLLAGDVAVDHKTGGQFWVSDPARESERLERFEVSPTGPIFGTKMKRPRGEAAKAEDEAMDAFGLPPVSKLDPPRGLRLYGDRRPLRVRLQDATLAWHAEDSDTGAGGRVELAFVLPAGSYASVLVQELFPENLEEVSGAIAPLIDDAEEAH